jgi:hypothetical protein
MSVDCKNPKGTFEEMLCKYSTPDVNTIKEIFYSPKVNECIVVYTQPKKQFIK